ncbi:MAG TPA: hypothetical protein VOA87_12615 [Thermoanaerobaculia bacterium]|nr:hypothetical protein [Thermoanaerobaculia bacterium]
METRRNGNRGGLVLLFLALAAAPAAAWEVNGDAPAADFHAFDRRFSADAYFYPRHGAAPLGLVGFEVWADATYDSGFDNQPFANTVVKGSLTGGFLSVDRVGVRKGLPGGFDLGASYGATLGGDVRLLSAELQYAIASGGLVAPALSIRLTGSRTLNARAYDLSQYGAELLLSKGFTVLTPYVGVGIVHSRGRLRGSASELSDSSDRGIAYAGLTLNLLLPKITVEVERGEVVQGAVRVGFGF